MRDRIDCPAPNRVYLHRSEDGVPHIDVRSDELYKVSWAMGYCHALDRGLAMLLMRILANGRASELLDASDEMLEVDRFFRRMGWTNDTRVELEQLDEPTRTLVHAYCDGVNTRFGESVPWELRVLGVVPEPWTPQDSVTLSRMIGYVTLAQSQAEMERLIVEMVQAGVDEPRLRELFPSMDETWDRALIEKVTLGERIVPAAVRWLGAIPRAMASNNWVVSGSKSASGKPMLANDPHLEVNRLPAVWYELVCEWGEPDARQYALMATMPGLPAPLLARTADLSWGATYTFMDGVDSWVEECRGGKRRRGDDWVSFETRTEVIERKGKAPFTETFYECEHGVLDGDPNIDGFYLATRWAPGRSGSGSLTAAAKMWGAHTVVDGMAALAGIESSWNWVLADREGHIGYQMSGLMPRRREGVSGLLPLAGWDPANDWQGFIDPVDLPRAYDPADGIFVTANQDLNEYGRVDPINLPMGDYRARRIREMLEESRRMGISTHAHIQNDVFSIQAREMMAILGPLLPDDEAGRAFAAWDGCYDVASTGAVVFERWYAAVLRLVFGAGGFGVDVVDHLLGKTGIFIDFYQNFDTILRSEASAWLAGRDRDALFREAYASIAGADESTWGEQQTMTLSNIFFASKLPGWLGFDRGPVSLQGGRATPHQGQIYRSGDRVTSFAPSYRLITDMAEHTAHTCLAGGPSDRRTSKFYCSELDDWLAGRYKILRPKN